MPRASLIFAILLCVCSSEQAQNSTLREGDILGAWILQEVAGKSLDTVNVKSHRIVFSDNHQWTYSSVMNEKFGGMQLNGSGSWKIVSGSLEYTAGANSGRSAASVNNGVLTLSPDPVIMPGGKQPAVTKYRR